VNAEGTAVAVRSARAKADAPPAHAVILSRFPSKKKQS
jgi:hypothetical protein